MKRFTLIIKILIVADIILTVLMLMGCVVPAQKGGRSAAMGAVLEQGENPAQPSSQTTTEEITREYDLWDHVKAVNSALTRPLLIRYRDELGNEQTFTNTARLPLGQVRETIKRQSSTTLGAAQKDEARSLGAKFAAMRPVQWTGIALCAASIAAFWWGWPTLGFLAIGVGAGMIILAAVIPGHEMAILIGGGVLVAVASLLVVYAWKSGKLDKDGDGKPDFLK